MLRDGLDLIAAGSCIIGVIAGLWAGLYEGGTGKDFIANFLTGLGLGILFSLAIVAFVIACILLGGGVLTVVQL